MAQIEEDEEPEE